LESEKGIENWTFLKMSKNANPKIVLKIGSFSGVLDHNGLKIILSGEKVVTLFFTVLKCKIFRNFLYSIIILQMTTNLVQTSYTKFICKKCNYSTCRKSQYERHLSTPKHQITTNTTNLVQKSSECFVCETCNKIYKHHSSLWNHKKKCLDEPEKITTTQNQGLNLSTEVVLQILKQNEDLQKLLVDQTSKIIEMAKEGKNIINNTNNTNNTTNNFNLNLFLNEKCKDAINITDFVNSLVVSINDLEETARLGYAEGISKIFINGLKQLDVYKRPIHCSDLKREVLYIKDQDNWEKDDDKKHLLQAIKVVGNKNIKQISEWQKINPHFKDPESKQNDKYLSMICNVMSGGSTEETAKNYDKIVRNIVRNCH